MARCIDADKLCEALKSMASTQYPDKQNTILGVVSSIENFPTADVVPESEAEEYKHNWQKIQDSYTADCLEHYNRGRVDVAREIFEEIEKHLVTGTTYYGHCIYTIGCGAFAELKKKYPEAKNENT